MYRITGIIYGSEPDSIYVVQASATFVAHRTQLSASVMSSELQLWRGVRPRDILFLYLTVLRLAFTRFHSVVYVIATCLFLRVALILVRWIAQPLSIMWPHCRPSCEEPSLYSIVHSGRVKRQTTRPKCSFMRKPTIGTALHAPAEGVGEYVRY